MPTAAAPGPAHAHPPDVGWRHPRRVAGVLLGLLVAWYVAVAWTAPQRSSIDDLRRDVASHRIASYWLTDDDTLTPAGALTGRTHVGATTVTTHGMELPGDPHSTWFVWRTADGRAHRVDGWELPKMFGGTWTPVTLPDGSVDMSDHGRLAGEMMSFAQLAGPSGPRNQLLDDLAGWTGWLPRLAVVALFLTRRPQRGTRWYWFWMAGLPLGLGVLWFIRTELFGTPRADGHRSSGWVGFGVNFLVSSVTQTLAAMDWNA